MKKRIVMLFSLLLMLSASQLNAQQWVETIPQERLINGEVSFFEIQKAFNDYWAPKDVVGGFYELDGERVKAAGWKQFKRWEWFWQSRVDIETGMFPQTSPFHELQKYREDHPNFKSGSQSGNWVPMGPYSSDGGYSGIGRLNCVAFHPSDNNTFYVGSAGGGIWKTSDAGASWIPMSDDIGSLGVSDIVVFENGASETIYIATGDKDAKDNYSIGVLKSTDGGLSWNLTGLNWSQSFYRTINRLLMDPADRNILYAASNYGLYKTSDAGLSWSRINTTHFADIEFKPGDPSVIYASTGVGGDIYRSLDSGITFTMVLNTGGSRAELAVSADDPEVVYSLVGNTSTLYGIYKSTNGGGSFSMIHGSSPNLLDYNCDGSGTSGQAWYDLCIAADPNDANKVFVGGINTWGSLDGGNTWDIKNMWSGNCGGSAQEVHADKHNLTFKDGSSTLFECNDGGLYRSDNSGASWIDLSDGLVISQLYKLGVSQTNSGDVITGLQDNGTKSLYGGAWDDKIGGDGMECAIDPTNNNIQYGSLYYGKIFRTVNHWGSSTVITGEFGYTGAWVTPYVLDPNAPSTVYVGYKDVWKRNFAADVGWVKISNLGLPENSRSLAVAPSNSDVICVATQTAIYRTVNGGSSWTTIPRPANSSISNLHIDNDDPDHMWVSFGQFTSNGVFETFDGGNSWTDITAGIPAIPVNCVIKNKQNTRVTELYAGTDLGVYIKLGSNDWVMFSEGLPNVVVTDLEIYYDADPASSKLRAATYGRGLWESGLYEGIAVNPVTFTSDPVYTADGTEDVPYSGSIAPFVNYSGTETLVYTKETGPVWLTLDQADGSLSGTPTNEDVGLNKFSVKTSAGADGTAIAELQINVINTNDAPVFNTDPVRGADANEGSAYTGSLAQYAGDIDGDALAFSKISGPEWLIVASGGNLSGTPGLADRGANQWIVRVSDGNGGADDAVLDIYVLPVNHPPVFTSDPIIKVGANEDLPYNASLATDATDPDTDELIFSKVSGPSWLGVSSDGSLSGTPVQTDVGANTFIVKVEDGKGGSDESALNIEVTNVNDAPVFLSNNITRPDAFVEMAYAASIGGVAVDEDGDPVSYSLTGPAWLTCTPAGELSGTPLLADEGTNSWSVLADDGNGGTAMATLQINVTGAVIYCLPGIWNNDNEWINSVVFNGSAFSTGKDLGGYGDHTDIKFQADANSVVNFTLSPGYSGRSSFAYWNIWIDYNKDGFFDGQGELVYTSSKKKGDFSDVFTLAGTPLSSRMRISVSGTEGASPCNDFRNGEVEDYTFEIVTTGPKPPMAEFSADQTSIIPETVVSFADMSSDGPAAWHWTFGNGQTSNEQNPSVIFSSVGIYTVSLEVSNIYGSDLITKEGYIVVSEKTGGDYCEPLSIDNSLDYINSISINGKAGAYGQGQYGYYHYLSPVFDLPAGGSYTVSLEPFNSKNRNFWRIWIDFNGDGDFDDSDETLLVGNNKKGSFSDVISIPSYVATGLTRMRISMETGSSPASCDDYFQGEVEDYDVNLNPGSFPGLRGEVFELDGNEPVISIFPNPVRDILTVHAGITGEESYIRVYDMLGHQMLWVPVLSDYTDIDVISLQKGVYLMVYESQGRRFVNKFVKD